jgi:outer membrane protein OmpA-like peptidoglycan-associated protein
MNLHRRLSGIAAWSLAIAMLAWSGAANASAFTEALTKDYFALATVQYYYSHDPFAVKARAADQGKNVLPDDPAKKKLSTKDRTDLTAAHGRLMAALNGGFREQNPKQASKAQTSFDCWLRAVAQSGGKDWKCIRDCREAFEKAMAAWKPPVAAKPAPKPAPAPVAKPAPKPAPPPPPRSFIVFFDWNHTNIRADAQRVIDAAVAYAKERGLTRITLVGHADRSGDAKYNQWISERRAARVKAALGKLGFQAGNVSAVGRGESTPLVSTADGVREPRNRRVEISF